MGSGVTSEVRIDIKPKGEVIKRVADAPNQGRRQSAAYVTHELDKDSVANVCPLSKVGGVPAAHRRGSFLWALAACSTSSQSGSPSTGIAFTLSAE